MKRLAVLALAALLSGCSFSLPFSGPTQEVQYYVLGAPSSPAKALTAPRIGVMPVSMPGYLSRPQLVIREAIGKDFDAGRDWVQEEKGTTEYEMAGWYHRLDGCESE